jgi:hypothetical protein
MARLGDAIHIFAANSKERRGRPDKPGDDDEGGRWVGNFVVWYSR